MFEQQETHPYLNPVAVDRAQDFERFLLDVVEPAIRTQRPDLMGRWRILKPTRPEASDDGVLTSAFLFDGGDMDQDWELAKLLPRQYGEGEAQRLISDWLAMFVPYKRGSPPSASPRATSFNLVGRSQLGDRAEVSAVAGVGSDEPGLCASRPSSP